MTATSAESPDATPGPRDLRLYLVNRFLSNIAVQFQVVAVAWQIYDITSDPLALGYVGLFEFLPMVVLALPAGDLADRVNRRTLLIVTYIFQAIAAAALIALTYAGVRDVWPYYFVILLFGIARGLSTPAQQSILPFLVSPENLPRAIAASSVCYTIANISGPAIGGVILALAGPAPTYAACLIAFLVSIVAMSQVNMRHPASLGIRNGTAAERIADGLRYTWRQPIIFGAISLDLFAVLLGGAVALLPIYQRDILQMGPMGLGLLRSAPGIGAAIVALILMRWPLKRHAGNAMFLAVGIFGVATIVFAVSRNFYVSFVALALSGAADLISVYVRSATVQLVTPDHLRGRVGSVNSLFVSASNELGTFRAGVMAAWIGTVPAVVFGGVGTLVVVGLWMWLFPVLRSIDRLSELAPEPTPDGQKPPD